jgi:hypothetical protein
MKSLVAVLLAAVASAQIPRPPVVLTTDCTYSTRGSTYDLSPLQKATAGSYVVADVRQVQTANFSYVFNVCGQAQAPPGFGGQCATPQPAYQVQYSAQGAPLVCYALSQSVSLGWNITLARACRLCATPQSLPTLRAA